MTEPAAPELAEAATVAPNVLAFRPATARADDMPTPPGEQPGNLTCECGSGWFTGGSVVIDAETGSVTGRSCFDWRCLSCGKVSADA